MIKNVFKFDVRAHIIQELKKIVSYLTFPLRRFKKWLHFLIKIVLAYPKKRTDNPKEESITEDPFEEPSTKETKRSLSQTTIKRKLSLRNLKKTQS